MELNKTIINLISILTDDIKKIDKFLTLTHESLTLQIEKNSLVEISDRSIKILGKEDISSKISIASKEIISRHIDFEQLKKFCTNIDFLRLNHFGVSYSCPDISKELEHLKKLLHTTDFKLFEEKSNINGQRWFFLGNPENWRDPLFEIALTESKEPLRNKWIPHFQIDIDTDKSFEELRNLSEKFFGADIFDWKLDIYNYGIVLTMCQLGNICGTKVYLGLGTKLRNTKSHRKELLTAI